jgi:DNA-binding LacI/PurR family transcriptional regulator
MRNPVKRLKLYETIKSDIAAGIYANKTFLPNEFELAENYGYARGTVRSVLAMLENDKLIELLDCKSKGRRICPVPQTKAKPPISFLLPCSDYISEASSDLPAEISRRILKGISEAAFECDSLVQTVPVSPTNNAHEINWSKLDFVNADSRLVINSYWYRDLFPMLAQRGCRVALVENQTYDFELYADYLKEWLLLTLDRRGATESAVKLLAQKGYRRIALVHKDIQEKDHPVLDGYISGLAKCGIRYSAWLDTLNIGDDAIPSGIAMFYNKHKFDALLLEPRLAFRMLRWKPLNRCFGLPETVKIMTVDAISHNQKMFQPVSSMEFPYEEIGRVAAQRLMDDDFMKGQQIFSARTVERESARHETEQLVLTT